MKTKTKTKTKTTRIDTTWDPVTGCTPGQITLHPDRLEQPLKWKEPRRIFVCGMGDLFNTDVPDKFIIDCLSAMAEAWWHTFILSTKHPRRMRKIFTHPTIANDVWLQTTRGVDAEPSPWPLPNVWLGVTAENQATADKRILALVQTPAVAKFVFVEPMLEPVNLSRWLKETCTNCGGLGRIPNHSHIVAHTCPRCRGTGKVYSPQLKWVICGGETGPEARPTHPDWIRSLRDQCQAAGVPFFFKQWGAWVPTEATGATFELEKLKDNEVVVQEGFVDLEKVRKEILIKKINKALSEFEKKPTIYWTQTPMEKPLWEDLKAYVEKQIPKQPLFDNNGGCEYYEEWIECPVCGEAIPEYTAENETKCFCVGCGQKLSWGE